MSRMLHLPSAELFSQLQSLAHRLLPQVGEPSLLSESFVNGTVRTKSECWSDKVNVTNHN